MFDHAPPTLSSAAASTHGAASPSLELLEARQHRDELKTLLRKEQSAMAEFLVALADFDRRRGWERLGHASLFAFLHVELKLPNPSAFWRMSAARVLQRFPDLVEPLRDGRLCCSATAELAKVLTEQNYLEVLPRFFGLSAREAQELVAEIHPREAPATRTVVTSLASPVVAVPLSASQPPLTLAPLSPAPLSVDAHPNVVPPTQLRTSEVDFGGAVRCVVQGDQIEPLTADLRRLHVTVSREFLRALDEAREGLSHAIPNATTEQVLRAALDLLLEKQAKARGLVKRPRTKLPDAAPAATSIAAAAAAAAPHPEAPGTLESEPREIAPPLALVAPEPLPPRRTGPRAAIPTAVRRAVWKRDGGRCSWPLDGGGRCGSTHRLELDHVVPWARGGESTPANLRVVCAGHNRLAARQAFGTRCVERYAGMHPD